MLNTFFFGYLSLKWRRLVRTISFIFSIIPAICTLPWFFLGLSDLIYYGTVYDADEQWFVFWVSISLLVFIALLSWVIKPFVVKED